MIVFLFQEYFGSYGTVASVTLKMDPTTGRSRGFAFVVFEEVDPLNAALGTEHTIKNKKVAVKKAASKQGKIYVGKFNQPITEDEIKSFFAQVRMKDNSTDLSQLYIKFLHSM